MTIEVLRPSELTDELTAAWRAFGAADPALASPFLTPDWVQAVARVQGDRAARIAVAHHGGRPRAFFALRPGTFTALPVGAPLSDYQGVVAAPGARADLRAMLKAMGVARFDFTHVPQSQPAFAGGFHGQHTSWCVDVSEGWPAYLAQLKAKGSGLRKDLASRWKRMEREVGEVVYTPVNDAPEALAEMVEFKRKQYAQTDQPDVLSRDWTRRLLTDLLAEPGEGFGGRLSTLHAGGKLAAALYGVKANGVLHAWFLAHDHELGRHSPGMVLLGEVIREMGETGGWRELDFGPGDYPFKMRMANAGRELGYGFIGRPSPAVAFRGAAYWMRKRAEASPRLGPIAELPGKAMRRWDVIRSLGA